MKTIIELDEVKKLVKKYEDSGRKSAIANVEFSDESISWLKENGYYIKNYKGFTAFSKTESSLPSDDEFEEYHTHVKTVEEGSSFIESFIMSALVGAILQDLFESFDED